ncbi:MAG TPA: hypothetical protein VMR45_00670 [Patescibacteria group bacterium]|nr:hypothetical protein [Patescibacteria group bacterium]
MHSRALVKTIFGLVLVVGLWNLLQIEVFDNAVLQFITAGMVPGTDIVLTPLQMYWAMGIFFVVSFCLIFFKQLKHGISSLYHLIRRTKRQEKATEFEAAAIEAATAAETEAEEVVEHIEASKLSEPVVVIATPRRPGKVSLAIQFLKPRAVRLFNFTVRHTKRLFWLSMAYARTTGVYISIQTVRAWQWAEPRIRQMDKKIEQKLKSNKDIAVHLRFMKEAVKLVQSRLADLWARLNRVVEK